MNKFCVYSACIGGYDNIHQPLIIDERFDYILFVDKLKEKSIGVWNVRKVEYTNPDKTRISRYVKTHPELLLSEYDATLWLDMTNQIADKFIYERFIELYSNNTQIASTQHPERDCIYVEAFTMSNWCYEHDEIAFEWCHKLRKERYPRHRGLYETGILYRRKSDLMAIFNRMWWDCINQYSKRDQFSCNYIGWKLGVEECLFLPAGEHCLNSKSIIYNMHNRIARRKLTQPKLMEKVRLKVRKFYPKLSMHMWYSLSILPLPRIVLLMWGIISGIYGIPPFIAKKIKDLSVEK